MNNKKLRKKLLNIFSDKQIEEIAKYSKLKKRKGLIKYLCKPQ